MKIIRTTFIFFSIVMIFSCGTSTQKKGSYVSRNSLLAKGNAYRSGKGVEKDMDKARYYYEKASKQGVHEATYNLGVMYLNGDGVKRNRLKASEYFKTAANEGDLVPAQYNLGMMYYKGDGIPRDMSQAKYYFQKAADKGHKKAQKWADKIP